MEKGRNTKPMLSLRKNDIVFAKKASSFVESAFERRPTAKFNETAEDVYFIKHFA